MSTKTFPAKAKAVDDGEGVVEALVATYAVDSVGDRIIPGAFEKSLGEWAESGNPIPFIWSHQHNDIDAYLGDVLEAKETDEGLVVRAQLDMDDPQVRKVYRQIKGGRVKNYSFAYDVIDEAPGDDGANELKQLKLYEVGPTLIGANELTQTLAVKNMPTADNFASALTGEQLKAARDYMERTYGKAGRTLSAKNEQKIRDAVTALQDVLSGLGEEPKEGHAQHAAPAKDEEPKVKSEEPNPTSPADDLLTVIAIHEQEI